MTASSPTGYQFTTLYGDNNFCRVPHPFQTYTSPRMVTGRASGCAFGGYLFTLGPSTDTANNAFAPILTLNAVPSRPQPQDQISRVDGFAIEYANSYSGGDARTAWSVPLKPATDSRFITAMCAGSMGSAYATWIERPWSTVHDPNVPIELSILKIDFAGGSPYPVANQPLDPVAATVKVTIDKSTRYQEPQDLACAVVGGKAFYFITFWNDPGLYCFTFDGAAVTPIVRAPFQPPQGWGVRQNWSLDVAAVYSPAGIEVGADDTVSGSPELLAVSMALEGDDDKGHVVTAFFSVDDTTDPDALVQRKVVELPDFDAVSWIVTTDWLIDMKAVNGKSGHQGNVSIRCGWGAPWDAARTGTPIKNGLIVAFSLLAIERDEGKLGGYANSGSACATFVLDLEALDTVEGKWANLAPPDDEKFGFPDATFIFGASQHVTTPQNGDGTVNTIAGYNLDTANYVTLETGGYSAFLTVSTWYDGTTTSIQWPSFRLLAYGAKHEPRQGKWTPVDNAYTNPIIGPTWDQATWEAEIPSWTLVGVVLNIPPLPGKSDPAKVKNLESELTIRVSELREQDHSYERTSTFAVTLDMTAKLSKDEKASVSAGFSHGSIRAGGSSTTVETDTGFDISFQIESDKTDGGKLGAIDVKPNHGFLLYQIPIYQRTDYTLLCWDGSAPAVPITVIDLSLSSFQKTPVPFDRTTGKIDSAGILSANAQIVDGALAFSDRYPLKSDIYPLDGLALPDTLWAEDWSSFPGLPEFVDAVERRGYAVSSVTIEDEMRQPESLKIANATTWSYSTTNTIRTGASVDLDVISFAQENEYESKTEWSFEYEKTLFFDFTVKAALATANPSFDAYTLKPFFITADDIDEPWVPVASGLQKPWLLGFTTETSGT